MPTGTSVASRRGEGKEIGTVDGIKVGFTTGFGTATLPTGASVASPRGEEGLLAGLRPVRRSAYSENAGIRCVRPAGLHIQRPGIRLTGPAPGIFSGPRHIQRVPGVSVALVDVAGRAPGIFSDPQHIHRTPGISRARRRRGCRLCPSHRRGCCRSGWRGWSG